MRTIASPELCVYVNSGIEDPKHVMHLKTQSVNSFFPVEEALCSKFCEARSPFSRHLYQLYSSLELLLRVL